MAAGTAVDGAESGIADERTHAPASTAVRGGKKGQANDSSSSMLPSIDKGHSSNPPRGVKHSKELMPAGPDPDDALQHAPSAAADAGSSLGHAGGMGDHADEGSSSTLPPIGGGFGQLGGGGGGSGMPALKIDSKSLMTGSKVKTNKAPAKGAASRTMGVPKGPATHPPKGVGVGVLASGSQLVMQSRSCASCGDGLDFGVAGSSAQHATQHASQPSGDDGGGKSSVRRSNGKYKSPYKQHT